MNVASLELSKELYAVSGWGATDYKWCHTDDIGDFVFRVDHYNWQPKFYNTEAYDLGYLLRKLPVVSEVRKHTDFYLAAYVNVKRLTADDTQIEADTPEDAAARLAIELFKQGILTKEEPHA